MKPPDTDPSDLVDGSVALEPERSWDLCPGPRNGHAAALRVPCSEGPASMRLEPSGTSVDTLMAAEPRVDPMRFMELGAGWTPRSRVAVHVLDRPIHPNEADPLVAEVLHGRAGRR
jgi:hypothetical protein